MLLEVGREDTQVIFFMVSTLKGKQQLPAIIYLFYCYEVAKKVQVFG